MGAAVHMAAPLLIVLVIAACTSTSASANRSTRLRQAGSSTAAEIRGPEGAPVEMTCTPSGPEVCHDAVDNNCNGLLDEGCGTRSGPLHFAIAWDHAMDVDLDVTDPKGIRAQVERAPGVLAQSLIKDRDCGGKTDPCRGQNVENVFSSADRPVPGAYQVRVRIEGALASDRFPVRVRFGGRIGAKTFGLLLDFASSSEIKRFVVAVESDRP